MAERLVDVGMHTASKGDIGLFGAVCTANGERRGRAMNCFAVAEILASCKVALVAMRKASAVIGAIKGYVKRDSEEAIAECDIVESLSETLLLLHSKTKKTVEVDFLPETRPMVLAVPERLGRIWMNLAVNALDAMAYKGRLGIRVREEGGFARVDVADDGHGIAPDILERIWDPFYTTKPKGAGTGLGLAMVAEAVGQIGGRIEVRSVPGNTVFSVWIPLADAAGPVVREGAES